MFDAYMTFKCISIIERTIYFGFISLFLKKKKSCFFRDFPTITYISARFGIKTFNFSFLDYKYNRSYAWPDRTSLSYSFQLSP